MPDIQGIIAIIGAIAFFAGLFGGFRAKDLEVHPLPKVLRIFAFLIGVVFIGVAIWPFIRKEILTTSSPTVTPTAINISELVAKPTFTPELPLADRPIPPTTAVSTATPSTNDCSQMIAGEHHSPTLGVDWKFEAINEDRIIHLWSNHWDPNLPEFKFFLPVGQPISFKSGGGSVWIDRPGCNGVAEVIFQRDTFREITFEQYQKYIEQKIIP